MRKQHSLTYSSSQLSIEVSKLHAGANGRLEITCVSTIPATIAPLEQYADYKSVSVKGKQELFYGVVKNFPTDFVELLLPLSALHSG